MLVKQELDLGHQVTQREQVLVGVERMLQVASSAALLALHSVLAKAKEVNKLHKELG